MLRAVQVHICPVMANGMAVQFGILYASLRDHASLQIPKHFMNNGFSIGCIFMRSMQFIKKTLAKSGASANSATFATL